MQRSSFFSAIAAFACALVVAACAGRSPPCASDARHLTKRARMEAAVARFMTLHRAPGVAIGIVENGQTSWAAGFGVSDLENPVKVDEHTLFRLASISKVFTAISAMRLTERAMLDLDAPVQRYCPAFPDKGRPITTRQLLAHRGGIRHYKSETPDDPEISNVKPCKNPLQDGLDFFARDPLVAEPGTKFVYSTQGYILIGCVVEGASHSRYADWVRESILRPAGMSETVLDDRLGIVPRRTRFYRRSESGAAVLNADPHDSCYKVPSGGWLSSAADMTRFAVSILNDRLLERATRDTMWAPVGPGEKDKPVYSLGWRTNVDDGVATVGHTGGQQGTTTVLLMAPSAMTGVVVLVNMEKVPALDLAKELLKVALQER
jgi:CubicO group peptidase (beta-lactamase class C family)